MEMSMYALSLENALQFCRAAEAEQIIRNK